VGGGSGSPGFTFIFRTGSSMLPKLYFFEISDNLSASKKESKVPDIVFTL
jgi:hypothetical protein